MGLTKKGQKIVTNRNCHRSILTGMIISGAEPLWLIPKKFDEWGIWGNVTPESVEEMLSKIVMQEWYGLQTLHMKGLYLM